MIPQHTLDDSVSTADSRRTRWDDRAVSEILGAILLFALVVLLIALIQLNAVPAANQQVEFEHNQRVQGDLQEFQEVFFRSATTDTDGTVAIEAGTGYPSRFFLFNPPSPTGTVSVGEEGTVSITGAEGTGDLNDYLDKGPIEFRTKFLTYSPNYNEYRNPPTTVYENGVLYNEFANDQRVVSEQRSFINGRTISLVALQGQYATGTSGSLSLSTTPISAPAQEVTVSAGSDPITISIPTKLSKEEWMSILEDELDDNGGYIKTPIDDPDTDDGYLTIDLVENENYNLRLAAVGVGTQFDTETEKEYIVDISGNGETVPEGGSQRLVAQVRDKYNNPVSGVAVAAEADTGTVSFVDGSSQTDNNGQVQLNYQPDSGTTTSSSRDVTVWFTTDGTNPSDVTDPSILDPVQRVEFDLSAAGSGDTVDTGNGDDFNPATGLILESSVLRNPDKGNCNNRNQECVVDVTFENTNPADTRIRSMRVSFYSSPDTGSSPRQVNVTEAPAGSASPIEFLEVGGNFRSVGFSPITTTETYEFDFEWFQGGANQSYGSDNADTFIIEVITESGGQLRSTSYVMSPTQP
jgi:flagellin-like protein